MPWRGRSTYCPAVASHRIQWAACRFCQESHAAVPESYLRGSRANTHAILWYEVKHRHQEGEIALVGGQHHWKAYISCPASLTISHSSRNVSSECPGTKKVDLMPYLSNNFRRRRTPTVPAKRPFVWEKQQHQIMRFYGRETRAVVWPHDDYLVRYRWRNPRPRRSQASPLQRRCRPRCSRGPLDKMISIEERQKGLTYLSQAWLSQLYKLVEVDWDRCFGEGMSFILSIYQWRMSNFDVRIEGGRWPHCKDSQYMSLSCIVN